MFNTQSVTITLPGNYISGTIAAAGSNFATATTCTAPTYIVATSADVAAGAITLTLTGATIGGPMPAMNPGVQVSSTTDQAGVDASVALGGIVTGCALTIATSDRIAAITNRKIVVIHYCNYCAIRRIHHHHCYKRFCCRRESDHWSCYWD
jgi:hypothetical protein